MKDVDLGIVCLNDCFWVWQIEKMKPEPTYSNSFWNDFVWHYKGFRCDIVNHVTDKLDILIRQTQTRTYKNFRIVCNQKTINNLQQ